MGSKLHLAVVFPHFVPLRNVAKIVKCGKVPLQVTEDRLTFMAQCRWSKKVKKSQKGWSIGPKWLKLYIYIYMYLYLHIHTYISKNIYTYNFNCFGPTPKYPPFWHFFYFNICQCLNKQNPLRVLRGGMYLNFMSLNLMW